jgi:hypothetical protein
MPPSLSWPQREEGSDRSIPSRFDSVRTSLVSYSSNACVDVGDRKRCDCESCEQQRQDCEEQGLPCGYVHPLCLEGKAPLPFEYPEGRFTREDFEKVFGFGTEILDSL